MQLKQSERWGSRIGVILAVSGSAVGLGNFLRFPGQAAQYGGGAFMIAYFVALLVIGLPICWAEWTMGRRAGQQGWHSTPGIFHFFVRKPFGKYLGAIGVVIPVVIYMYYVVIEAWCLGYAVGFLRGAMHFASPEEAGQFFAAFVGISGNAAGLGFSWDRVTPYLLIAFVLNFFLVYLGVLRGIELFCKYAMPTLVLLGIVILVRVLTLGTPDSSLPENTVNNGLGFMWNPQKIFLEQQDATGVWAKDRELVGPVAIATGNEIAAENNAFRVVEISIWHQLKKPQLWLAAAGQIFFSLSVGFGIILTYASYLNRKDDVVLSGLSATSANEFCEVALGGLITLPASVAFLGVGTVAGMASTFGLGFHVLPLVFSQMPLGALFGFCFFFLLFLAAVTSSLSMLQPGIAFLEEALRINRKMSVAILGLITALGSGFVLYFSEGLKALDTLDFWVGTFLIFVLATLQILVFGWVWGVRDGLKEANRGSILRLGPAIGWVMKYLSPAFLLTIFFMWVVVNVFGYQFETGEAQLSSYIIDLFVNPNLVAWLSVALILIVLTFVILLNASSPKYHQEEEPTP